MQSHKGYAFTSVAYARLPLIKAAHALREEPLVGIDSAALPTVPFLHCLRR